LLVGEPWCFLSWQRWLDELESAKMSYHAIGDESVATEAPSWCPDTGCASDDYQMVFLDESEPVFCARYCYEGWYTFENECGKWCFEDADQQLPESAGPPSGTPIMAPVPSQSTDPAKQGEPPSSITDAQEARTSAAAKSTPTWVYVAAGAVAVTAISALFS
jgi:hypothetical protein